MEGVALAAMLPLWSYKSELLSPNRKHTITFILKVTILAKAINRDKPSHPLAYCPPGRGMMVCYLIRGRCPRLLKVVPSRHRSACGSFSTTDFTDRTDSCSEEAIRQKPNKPLAVDARCLLRAIDAVSV